MPGHRYSVRLNNRTGARVLTVLSVDGVNAITGQTANPQPVRLRARCLAEHRGRRLAQEHVRDRAVQFHRARQQLCRAHRTAEQRRRDRRRRVPREAAGLARARRQDFDARSRIAAAVSADSAAAAPPPAAPATRRASASRQVDQRAGRRGARRLRLRWPQRPTPKPEESLGTGHGARESSYASYTTFERASSQPRRSRFGLVRQLPQPRRARRDPAAAPDRGRAAAVSESVSCRIRRVEPASMRTRAQRDDTRPTTAGTASRAGSRVD